MCTFLLISESIVIHSYFKSYHRIHQLVIAIPEPIRINLWKIVPNSFASSLFYHFSSVSPIATVMSANVGVQSALKSFSSFSFPEPSFSYYYYCFPPFSFSLFPTVLQHRQLCLMAWWVMRRHSTAHSHSTADGRRSRSRWGKKGTVKDRGGRRLLVAQVSASGCDA